MWWKRAADGLVVPGVPLEPGRQASPSKADKVFYRGGRYALSWAAERETPDDTRAIVYSEWRGRMRFITQDTGRKPEVLVPRPELWDGVVPVALRGRAAEVIQRLREHSGHEVRYGPDRAYPIPERRDVNSTEANRDSCPVCDTEVVAPRRPNDLRPGTSYLDMETADQAIRARVADGRFEVIRAAYAIDDIVAAVIERGVYTSVAFLRCTASDETIFWGLSSYGDPIYDHQPASAPFTWPWNAGEPRIDNAPWGP